MEQAHRAQILYYLWYLKRKGVSGLTGMINYPKLHRREQVVLTDETELQVKEWIHKTEEIIRLKTPPIVNDLMRICKKCSYCEMCWG